MNSGNIRIQLMFYVCLLSGMLSAQQAQCVGAVNMVSADIDVERGELVFEILARDRYCRAIEGLMPKDIRLEEKIAYGDTLPLQVLAVEFAKRSDTVNLKADTVQILFIVERGKRIDAKKAGRQYALVQAFNEKYAEDFGYNTNYWVSTIGQDPGMIRGGAMADFSKAFNELRNSPIDGGEPDLYRSIISNLNELKRKPGRKIVFLFISGAHQSNPKRYGPNTPKIPPGLDDVLTILNKFGSGLHLYPVLLEDPGAERERALEQMVEATQDPMDVLAYQGLPRRELDEVVTNQSRLIATHRVRAATSNTVFRGERRNYCLTSDVDVNAESCLPFRIGSLQSPVKLGEQVESLDYVKSSGWGGILVALLLLAFALLFPLIRQWRFRSQHVVAYVPIAGRTHQDPVTREPIRAGDQVVNICKVPVPIETWRECDYQCPHYPGCTKNTLQCKGEGARENQSFFKATGVNRMLNWIWFGALGGLVGWLLFAIIDWFTLDGMGTITVYADYIVRQYTYEFNADTLLRDALVGACFGTGIILLLSIMEERTQSRKFSYTRIGFRTVIGALVSLLIFSCGFLLQASGKISYPILAATITWFFFGLGIGVVLMINSSISNLRGMVGGMLAGLLGFAVFWAVSSLLQDYLFAKMISFILTGAVLGAVLDTVIHLAEDYQMQYTSPAEYGQNLIPLSKWLKNGFEIIIGTQEGCQVYIKWSDPEVEPEHAKIVLEGGRVFLVPFAETLVNGHMVIGQKKTQLHDGDLIQLGRNSYTEMRFSEKQKVVEG